MERRVPEMRRLVEFMKAVDVCFKCFHVLRAAYPAESNVWLLLQMLLLQRSVYRLTTNWDVKSAAVSTLTLVTCCSSMCMSMLTYRLYRACYFSNKTLTEVRAMCFIYLTDFFSGVFG